MVAKILLIDDEELVIKTVNKLLLREGFEVILCRSGEEAVEKAKGQTMDLVICDVRMPGINGIETIKRLRALQQAEKRPLAPEIIITGYAEEEANKEIEQLKVADYIFKPFDIRDFLNCIRKHVKITEK